MRLYPNFELDFIVENIFTLKVKIWTSMITHYYYFHSYIAYKALNLNPTSLLWPMAGPMWVGVPLWGNPGSNTGGLILIYL